MREPISGSDSCARPEDYEPDDPEAWAAHIALESAIEQHPELWAAMVTAHEERKRSSWHEGRIRGMVWSLSIVGKFTMEDVYRRLFREAHGL